MFQRIGASIRRFLAGRYGSDALNCVLLVLAVVVSLANNILANVFLDSRIYTGVIYHVLWLVMMALLVLSLVRSFSRNIPARRRENARLVQLWTRLRDRKNRYFRCPNCRQLVRVPRGRGKVSIRCPKCGEKFIRKT